MNGSSGSPHISWYWLENVSRRTPVFASKRHPYAPLRPWWGNSTAQRNPFSPTPSSEASLRKPRAAHRADAATWRRKVSSSLWERARRGRRRRGFCSPIQRGDVTAGRRFSPPLPLTPPHSKLPVLDVASPPSTLSLRACLRAAEVAARAGRTSALLLLVIL